MRIALTGATGLAGHPIALGLSASGHHVVTLGRRPSALGLPHLTWQLGETSDLSGIDAVVHAAFSHVPGRYRGGEGDDPDGFLTANRDGSLRIVEEAAGRPILFLSSRAVYGTPAPGTRLSEDRPTRPDTLYGRMKLEVEEAVAAAGGASLRATGLYGPAPPGRAHKWHELFADFAAGRPCAPRVGTEVHGADLALAVETILSGWPTPYHTYNVSDIVLDRHDLLMLYGRISGIGGHLPARSDAGAVREMETDRLRALGWRPRGHSGVEETLHQIVAAQDPSPSSNSSS